MWVVMDQTKQKPFRAEVLAEVTLQHSRFETRGADPQGKGTQRGIWNSPWRKKGKSSEVSGLKKSEEKSTEE